MDHLKLVSQIDGIDKTVKLKSPANVKNEDESLGYREAGNGLFQKKDYVKALKQYNRSVMLAPTSGDTSALALAFANR